MSYLYDGAWLKKIGWKEVIKTAGIGLIVGGSATILNHLFVNPPEKTYRWRKHFGIPLAYLPGDSIWSQTLDDFATVSGSLAFTGQDSRCRRKKILWRSWNNLLQDADALRYLFEQSTELEEAQSGDVATEAATTQRSFIDHVDTVVDICVGEMSHFHATPQETEEFKTRLIFQRDQLVEQCSEYYQGIENAHRRNCGFYSDQMRGTPYPP